MSRWHDRSARGIITWGNLPAAERIADRLADILAATDDILEILMVDRKPAALHGVDVHAAMTIVRTLAHTLLQPLPRPEPSPYYRDDDTAAVLDEIERCLNALDHIPQSDRDSAHDAIERFASPGFWCSSTRFEISNAWLAFRSGGTVLPGNDSHSVPLRRFFLRKPDDRV